MTDYKVNLMSDHKDQATDANRAPSQKTPSRSYGRSVHDEKPAAQDESAPTTPNAQKDGDGREETGSPSATS